MELGELMLLRPLPGSGVLLTLTRRCPLHCAHCSTRSTMDGEEPDAGDLLRFVESFDGSATGGLGAEAVRPEAVMFTGGEPLLLPDLVAELAAAARRAGTRSAVLTGGFFARGGPIPDRVLRAVRAVDHFSVSLDAHHEREVERAHVLLLVRQVLDLGVPASFHLVGTGPDDPYLADVTAEIRRVFGDRVPMLVNTLRRVGRAASWATGRPAPPAGLRALPCAMAAWPVVAFDGTVLACCNQEVVDRRPAPEHLTLGHIASDDWPTVRERALGSPVLRMVRTMGPTYLRERHIPSEQRNAAPGYCEGCRQLSRHPEVLEGARTAAAGAGGALLDQYAAQLQRRGGVVTLVRRHAPSRYAELVALGGPVVRSGGRVVTASEVLRTKLRVAAPALRAAEARLWATPVLGARYARYLHAMHGVVRASVPLMERAVERCAELGPADPLTAPLARYLAHHTEQERGHDDWLLEDIATLSATPTPLPPPPSPAVARLVGAQYYWIAHHHPVALLGYIAVLEANAPAPWLADRLARTAGLPAAALRTVREHADLDGDHTEDLHLLLDALPLTREQTDAVTVSALHTVDALITLYDTLGRPDETSDPTGGTP
jgi:hypothetical protein